MSLGRIKVCVAWHGPACARIKKLEVNLVNKKPDMVSLKWVVGLMSAQADSAEAALVEYGHNPEKKTGAVALYVGCTSNYLHTEGLRDEQRRDADHGDGA
jgi:hypothetical protein